MKYLLFLFCCGILAFVFMSCKDQSSNDLVSTKMSVLNKVQFKEKLAATPNPQLIDVRTPEEVAEGAIPNASNIDFYSDDFNTKISALDKKRPVFVYCKSGGRSGKTAKRLNKMGFNNVYDLKGGFSNWSE